MSTFIESQIINIIYSLTILMVGVVLAFGLRKILRKYLFLHNNEILKNFLNNLIFSLVLTLTVITALSKLGVPTASLVTILGAASLAVGLALRNFLSNIAAGFLIIFLHPFKIGDYIQVGGDAGTVLDINLFMVKLKSSTNESVFVPNNKIMNNSLINQSFYDTRRSDLIIGIGYGSDLLKVKQIIGDVINSLPKILIEPVPLIVVQELADNSINILIRYWTKREDLSEIKFLLTEKLLDNFNQNNINIPFPQLELHVQNSKADEATKVQAQ